MRQDEAFQLEIDSAKFYERYFVPTLFEGWAKIMIKSLHVEKRDRVLDIACGTGIVARTALQEGLSANNVTGCDLNEGMLAVAKEKAPEIDWIRGSAEELPFDDNSFDKISCQFGMMFFQDKIAALNEMLRVKDDKGRIVISIWNSIDKNQGYADLLELVEEIGGPDCAAILNSPFSLGDEGEIRKLLAASQMQKYEMQELQSEVVFPSIEYWIDCDVKASPMASKLTPDQYAELNSRAKTKLSKYVDSDGQVKFNLSAHLISIG